MFRAAPCWFASLLCLATCLVQTSHAADSAALKAAQKAYHEAGAAVVEMTQSKKVDVAQVEAKVVAMEQGAVVLSRAYASKFPAGAKLIATVIEHVAVVDAKGSVTALGPMKELSFQEIEDQWHDGAYFKSHDLGVNFEDEANEHFTDPIHTMVHPMMVLRAAMAFQKGQDAKDLQAMKDEMDEGMEQAEKMLEVLLK